MASPRPKLQTVEAARGIAALAVVCFHANSAARYMGHEPFPVLSPGEHGVDFFFVLSGFIIFFVHNRDIGRADRARAYMAKRFIRLFPILWVLLAACFLVKAIVGDLPSLAEIGTSVALYPSLERPYPLVLWTLRHELLFYLSFLVLIWNRKAGLWLMAAWAGACLAQLGLAAAGRPWQGLTAFFFSTYQLDFFLGALLAEAHRRWTFRVSYAPLALGVILIVVCLAVEQAAPFHRVGVLDYVSLPATLGTLALGLGFTVVLHGLLCIEPAVRVPRFLLLLGGASYAMYLIHTPINSLIQRLGPWQPPGLSHLVVIACGVAGGIALHLLIELPLARWLRGRMLRARPPVGEREPAGDPVVRSEFPKPR